MRFFFDLAEKMLEHDEGGDDAGSPLSTWQFLLALLLVTLVFFGIGILLRAL